MAGSHGRMYVPRTRGALSGFLIVLLGIWGGLMPYLGASFDYTYTPDSNWTWTAGRFWLQLLPALGAIVGGLVLIASQSRYVATLGGWLAAAAGGWFVVGPLLSPLWDNSFIGQPVGDDVDRSVEQIGLFFGLGAVIVFFAAFALGRLAVIGARDVELGERHATAEAERVAAERRADEAYPNSQAFPVTTTPVVKANEDNGKRSILHGRHRHTQMVDAQVGNRSGGDDRPV